MESELPGLARIDFVQAVSEVRKKVKGNLLSVELENENGFLVYGVEIVTPENSIVDVKVDAGSGKVLAMDRHNANDENYKRSEYRGDDPDHESGERDSDRDRED